MAKNVWHSLTAKQRKRKEKKKTGSRTRGLSPLWLGRLCDLRHLRGRGRQVYRREGHHQVRERRVRESSAGKVLQNRWGRRNGMNPGDCLRPQVMVEVFWGHEPFLIPCISRTSNKKVWSKIFLERDSAQVDSSQSAKPPPTIGRSRAICELCQVRCQSCWLSHSWRTTPSRRGWSLECLRTS